MTIIKHELKLNLTSFIIWASSIGALIAICIFIYPSMKGQMEDINNIFSSMGSFSEAFGMDQLNFGTLIGFYGVECGNILGLGGALYASYIAVSILSKEEKDKTSEFLLTHPISRKRIVSEKLIAVFILLTALNLIIYLLSIFCMGISGESIPFKEVSLLHLAYYILQIELGSICFGISSILHKGNIGIGLGISLMMYFVNIVANITTKAKFLKYITPFAYCDSASIISNGSLDFVLIIIGLIFATCFIVLSYLIYNKKDIK
ncbi:MAG: ABC transporter permease [Erysipelotrichaceae bacterium]|nr:ABC transporter permease [Erysipelotrichaceae bacterium]